MTTLALPQYRDIPNGPVYYNSYYERKRMGWTKPITNVKGYTLWQKRSEAQRLGLKIKCRRI